MVNFGLAERANQNEINRSYYEVGMEIDQGTREWALDALFGEEARDLSADGYASAMHRLRRESPALAQKVDRAIQPLRDKDFPRRLIPWQETSIGRRYRVALLPDNPYFRRDVALVRGALGLTEERLRCEVDNPIRTQLANSRLLGEEGDALIQYLAARVLARRWLGLHYRTSIAPTAEGTTEGLTLGAIAAARRTKLELTDLEGTTDWLQIEPPDHSDCLWDRHLPLHLAAALLLERHRLPVLMIHILTNSRSDLLGLESEQVVTFKDAREFRIDPPKHGISVLIQGVDEYTTNADRDRVWKEQIEPVLEEFRGERGKRPRGKQAPSLERLRDGLPLCERYLELSSIELALQEFQNADLPQGNLEDETARRIIRDLRGLLEPGFLPRA